MLSRGHAVCFFFYLYQTSEASSNEVHYDILICSMTEVTLFPLLPNLFCKHQLHSLFAPLWFCLFVSLFSPAWSYMEAPKSRKAPQNPKWSPRSLVCFQQFNHNRLRKRSKHRVIYLTYLINYFNLLSLVSEQLQMNFGDTVGVYYLVSVK